MTATTSKIEAVPTNIITGFLGAGKTSAILHLLKSKPENERWAVLVNEFGEIGIDGSLFSGQYNEDSGVFIREVPGGCMCCAAGLPMQIALNQLLTRAKPDRLLIEPTGLGHPTEVLQVLTSEYYFDVLSIEKIITLVDARNLADSNYTEHLTFNQQIANSDVIVGNKQDLYQPEDKIQLQQYATSKSSPEVEVIFTEHGQLPLAVLKGETCVSVGSHHHQNSESTGQVNLADTALPACGYLKAVNQGEGFHSVGWRFDASKIFNRQSLFVFLSGVSAARVKAVFITEEGIFGYNLTPDALTEIELDDCLESRIEIIATEISEDWETQLFACITTVNDG